MRRESALGDLMVLCSCCNAQERSCVWMSMSCSHPWLENVTREQWDPSPENAVLSDSFASAPFSIPSWFPLLSELFLSY